MRKDIGDTLAEGTKIASKRIDIVLQGVTFYSGERNSLDTYDVSIDPDCPNHIDMVERNS